MAGDQGVLSGRNQSELRRRSQASLAFHNAQRVPLPTRIGAACQQAYDVPAVTLSTLLLDGNVSDLLRAIALHRSVPIVA